MDDSSPRATTVIPAGTWPEAEARDTVTLDFDDRFRRRRLYNQAGLFQDQWSFDEEAFGRQVACAEFLDARTGELLDYFRRRGRPTTVVLCADHGECFGEHGLWGHALYHEKVMEVPLLIFRLNAPPHANPEPASA